MRTQIIGYSITLSLLFGGMATATAADNPPEFTDDQIEFFEKEVRPILVEHCHECHGPDEREGGLRLDARSNILKGGDTGPAMTPGKPDESELILAISYDPDGYQMPPDGKLSDELIDTLTKWVEIGAPWPDEEIVEAAGEQFDLEQRADYWSFQPLAHPSPPFTNDLQWPRTPVDRFLLARLEEAGLTPAAETDRRTWIRRASLDVIGLPPTPEEVTAFVEDDSPDAYERVVERLLASPHYGERWGRHWLDLVRYAESRGHEFDYDVANPWHYRDYVIRALNDDLPYDRFVVEHIAGDLLRARDELATGESPGAVYPLRLHPETGANESIVATGFWFFGEWVHSPVDIRQEEAERFENMIDVYAKTFLGLTVACARCHDHKFDPITQKDFYALQGYLQSSSYRQARFETMEHNRRISEKLTQLREEATPVLLKTFAEIVQPTVEKLDQYLLAAQTAIELGPEFDTAEANIAFESFEDGVYEGWEITGDAFGDAPQTQESIADYQGNVQAEGKFFVNSHQKRAGGQGDNHVGTLTSPEFTIERNYIRLLVGGGNHADKTCVNLLIDGRPVHSATGKNNNEMSLILWDVTAHRGKTARIQAVDNERGGWGNIGFDGIVFTDSPGEETAGVTSESFTAEYREQVELIATDRELDSELLLRWVAHLLNAADDEQDPFHFWALMATGKETQVETITEKAERLNQQPQSDDYAQRTQDAKEGRNFRATKFIVDGTSYRSPGQRFPNSPMVYWSDNPQQPLLGFSLEHTAQWNPEFAGLDVAQAMRDPGKISGSLRAGRTIRTPSFEIDRDVVYCLIRGGVNTYLAVDSHILINGPLHGTLVHEHPVQDGWRWIAIDASRYLGHRAHVEFIPRPGESFEVASVWIRERNAVPDLPMNDTESFASHFAVYLTIIGADADLAAEQVATLAAENAGAIVTCLSGYWHRFGSGPCRVGPAQWALDHPELFGLTTEDAKSRYADASTPFIERRRELVAQIRNVSPTTPAMLDGSGEDEYVFIRGAWRKRGETVPRRFLEVFQGQGPANSEPTANSHQPSANTGSGSGRLQLALQMVDPDQTPILPRVIVNRIWQHYFGRGIVPTPDDFGRMGQLPSHPELLDWLAGDLVRNDWSLKHIHRQILLSAAHRMDSATTGPADESDPENLLLHRMNIKRLEGEIIRDQVLAISGRIDDRLYGRSIPVHLTAFMEGRGRPGESGPVDGRGRRSLYISVRRNFPDPFFQAFDFPNPHSTIGRRSVSNVPAQALALMNNPFVVEQSRVWADRLLQDSPVATIEQRVHRIYSTAFSRAPTAEEQASAAAFIESQAKEYNATADDPRVWADYCHVLINVKEFVFVQ